MLWSSLKDTRGSQEQRRLVSWASGHCYALRLSFDLSLQIFCAFLFQPNWSSNQALNCLSFLLVSDPDHLCHFDFPIHMLLPCLLMSSLNPALWMFFLPLNLIAPISGQLIMCCLVKESLALLCWPSVKLFMLLFWFLFIAVLFLYLDC